MLMTVNNAITRPQGQSESEACGKYALMHTLKRLRTHTQPWAHTQIFIQEDEEQWEGVIIRLLSECVVFYNL